MPSNSSEYVDKTMKIVASYENPPHEDEDEEELYQSALCWSERTRQDGTTELKPGSVRYYTTEFAGVQALKPAKVDGDDLLPSIIRGILSHCFNVDGSDVDPGLIETLANSCYRTMERASNREAIGIDWNTYLNRSALPQFHQPSIVKDVRHYLDRQKLIRTLFEHCLTETLTQQASTDHSRDCLTPTNIITALNTNPLPKMTDEDVFFLNEILSHDVPSHAAIYAVLLKVNQSSEAPVFPYSDLPDSESEDQG